MGMEELSMRKYILETPVQLRKNIQNSRNLTQCMVDLYLKHPVKSMRIVACGSSYNAVLCARYFMKKILNVDVKIIPPFTFNHYEHDISNDDFVVCISQSGYSTNTIDSLRLCRKLGVFALGLTGNTDSAFKQEADEVIDFGLGGEKLDFVTKGVVTLTAFLMLFSLHAALRLGKLDEVKLTAIKNDMLLAVENYENILKQFDAFFTSNRKALLSMEKVYLIGAGANYGTVLEGAVKIGETVHVLAVGYETDEFIHGPQIQLTPNYNLIFIDSGDETSSRIFQAYQAGSCISDRVFILSNNPDIESKCVMRVPHHVPEELSPLYTLAFVQMLACTVAETNNTWKTHPLLENFKEHLFGKTDGYEAYDCT